MGIQKQRAFNPEAISKPSSFSFIPKRNDMLYVIELGRLFHQNLYLELGIAISGLWVGSLGHTTRYRGSTSLSLTSK